MMTTLGLALVLGLLGAEPAPPGPSASSAVPCTRVTVRIWDVVPVEKKVLERARAVAERVFRGTGTEIAWIECALDGAPSCSTPRGPAEISLRIYRRPEPVRRATGVSIGGVALRDDSLGIVHVHYDRLEEISREGGVPVELALGITAAHEFGHVLLGRAHSKHGIMRGTLGFRDWDNAAQEKLLFNPEQTSLLSAGACRQGPAKGEQVASRTQ